MFAWARAPSHSADKHIGEFNQTFRYFPAVHQVSRQNKERDTHQRKRIQPGKYTLGDNFKGYGA